MTTIDNAVYLDTVDCMLNCDSSVVTKHISDTQTDLQQTLKGLQPTWGHTLTKTAVGFAAGTAVIVIPTALLGMAVQSAATATCEKFEEHFFNVCEKIDLTRHIGYIAQSVGDTTGILSAVLTSTAGVTLLAGFSAIVATINGVLKNKRLSAATAAMTMFYMAKKTANFATKGFTAQEAKLSAVRENAEKNANSALEAYGKGLCGALNKLFSNAKESPEELNRLKQSIIDSNFLDQCKEANSLLPSIAGVKVDYFKDLTALAKNILAYEISMRADASDKYNWEVMMNTPVSEFARKCLPQSTKILFQKSKESSSSLLYEIKRFTHSSVNGLVSGVATAGLAAGAALAGMYKIAPTTYNDLWNCNEDKCKFSDIGIVSGVATSAVFLTGFLMVANRVSDSYDKVTEKRRKEIDLAASSSRNELISIYQGLLSQLEKRASKLTSENRKDITEKLKIAEKEFCKYVSSQEAKGLFKPLRDKLLPELTSIAVAR